MLKLGEGKADRVRLVKDVEGKDRDWFLQNDCYINRFQTR